MPRLEIEGVRSAWVFHRGALGDSVLTWPVLRHLARSGVATCLVADRAKAELAAECAGVVAIDAESSGMAALWREGAAVATREEVELVLDYEHGAAGARGANVRRMFPGARVIAMPRATGGVVLRRFVEAHPPARIDGRWRGGGCACASALDGGDPEDGVGRRVADGVPRSVVIHVGAGSNAKRWEMRHWRALHERLTSPGVGVDVIAGEVERERFTSEERLVFESMRGRYVDSLAELRDTIAAARAYVGNDSGPTHLAAQLGVPTVAVFGVTEPDEWAPIGRHARVVGAMNAWPSESQVLDAVTESAGHRHE